MVVEVEVGVGVVETDLELLLDLLVVDSSGNGNVVPLVEAFFWPYCCY